MNNISGGSYASYVAGYTYTASGLNKTEKKETANQNTANAVKNDTSAYGVSGKKEVSGKREVSGQTIGNPKLSEKASKYYDELKKKYSNMDFILVSKEQKANAQANAASYANGNKMVVLIDEEKIERMATDENYRKQYEGIIKNAASGLSQLKSQIESSGQSQNVVGYGMKVNDGGTASFFAVLKKSSADQKARIEKKAVEKKEAKKAEEKKAEKKEKQDKLKEAQQTSDDDDTITISAGSIEELIKKINDYTFSMKSDNVQTEAELQVGQHIDFRG